MPLNQDVLKTALRVLKAVIERHRPDSQDIEILQRFRGARDPLPPDELACEVIQLAMKARTAVHRAKIQ